MNYIKVQSVEQLNELLDKGKHEFVLLLAGGLLRSSKHISFDGEKYYVLHCIDDTEEQMTAEELMSSNIGTGIKNGAFYCETD